MTLAPLRALFTYIYSSKCALKTPKTRLFKEERGNQTGKKKNERLLECGAKKKCFLKIRPGCWEKWSSPLQARPKVNWGITVEGGGSP